MRRHRWLGLGGALACCGGAVVLAGPVPRSAQDYCRLVTRAEAATVLGGPVTELTPVSPQRDEDTGAEQTGCVYQQGDGLGLAVVLLTFSSAEAAGASLTDEVAAQQLGDPDVTLVAEPGLADRAYWAASDDLAAYVVLRGRYVLGMSLGGDGFRGAAAHRGALRRAAEAAVRRL